MSINSVLVVCIGNICRSPMAEALLRKRIETRYPDVSIKSAGIAALVGSPPAQFAQEIMIEKASIDIREHRARQLSKELLHNTELVLVMEQSHQKQIEITYPSIHGRVHRLGKWSGFDIVDPYRRSKRIFEQTLILIEESINEWQKRLWK